ncbi:MAG: alginate export family protein [Ignavibacteriales bacterium]|nr:MAG: hypothetical protein F9K26_06065 [Ignavibacteriaceae bacterium]MBW7874234.1 alginate export family protein [Ignavibacteria bacterium]MCZ2142294.1 alginate export family protein [Ignavibacteriales bacterium]MBV6445178.1 hypothetical protein [Ignavibacteriaceae bacterium]MBZ0195834.1 alginate export family protein [Ignavibacteriaceae bacterium]
MKRYILYLMLSLLFTPNLFSQLTVKFNGELRTRLEIDARNFNRNGEWQNYIDNRARLGAVVSNNDDFDFVFKIIDSRTFGQAGVQNNFKNIDLNEVYLKLNKGDWEFILGRQEAKYYNGRIIAPSDWGNVPIVFEGATARYSGKGYRLNAFAFRTAERLLPDDDFDRNLFGLFTEFRLSDNVQFNPFLLYDRATPPSELSRLTLGANSVGYLGPFNYDFDFAYQLGNISGGKNISALMAAITLDYNFRTQSKASVGVGFDFYSGDADPNDDKSTVFDNSYSSKHGFLGDMDYFKLIATSTWNLGVMDFYAYYKMALAPWLAAKLTGHYFNSDVVLKLNNGDELSNYGTEVDLSFLAKYNEYINFMFGGATFLPGDIFKNKFGDETAFWFYAGFQLSFSQK